MNKGFREGLKNIHKEEHDKKLPNTHDRGKLCIDIMAILKSFPSEGIIRSGILPFYHGLPSDHRALYIDLDTDYLFTNLYTDTTKNIYKRFSTKHSKKTDKYLDRLESDLEKAKIPSKVEKLKSEIMEYKKSTCSA